MKIEEIDRNFLTAAEIDEPDLVWLNAREAPFVINGVFYDEEAGCFLRMPKEIAEKVSPGVARLNRHTSGGRVRFRTDSVAIAIRAKMTNRDPMAKMTLAGQSGFDLFRGTERGMIHSHTFFPPVGVTEGFSNLQKADGVLRDYLLHFPLYDEVNELWIGLKKGAVLEAPTPYRDPLPIVYYGSSITQGGCASRPGNTYQAMIARKLNMDFVNLGFSGNAKGGETIARYIASLEMKAFVCDFDHNCKTAEELAAVHEPLVRTVRAAHPDLPIVLVSSPRSIRGEKKFLERRRVVIGTYEKLKAEGDKNLSFVDGLTLFEGDFWDSCTVDETHPNDLGFARMAQKIGEPLFKLFL